MEFHPSNIEKGENYRKRGARFGTSFFYIASEAVY